MEELPILELGWKIEQFYYFLFMAIQNGPIIPKQLENKIQYTYHGVNIISSTEKDINR